MSTKPFHGTTRSSMKPKRRNVWGRFWQKLINSNKRKSKRNGALPTPAVNAGVAKRYVPDSRKRTVKDKLQRLAIWRAFGKHRETTGELAEQDKKKKISKQRLALIAGAGVLAIAIVMVALLVPFGTAKEAAHAQDVQTASMLAAAAVQPVEDGSEANTDESTTVPEAEDSETAPPTASPTTSPDPTEIATVNAMETADPTPSPSPTKSPEPTTPPEPIPTTAPEPTPQPIDMDELVAYYEVEADRYYSDYHFSSNYYEYTNNELYVLAQLIHGEARGESWKGKIAVANVVMNRVLASGYPGDDIIEVVTDGDQFTGYDADINPSSSCKAAARAVLDDQVWVIPQHSFNFNSHKPEGEDWASHTFYTRIGNHNFYVDAKYRGRCQRDAVPDKLFDRTYQWPQYGCVAEYRVKRIQLMLHALGYDVSADKYFGIGTKDALKEFQKKHGLTSDGIAGPKTIEKLIEEYGISRYYEDFVE